MAVEPFFHEVEGKRLFCVIHRPAQLSDRAVLYVPPFAEEANRVRHLASRQARRLAAIGHAVLFVDPHGTGDSSGNFAEATWTGWCADMREALGLLHREGYSDLTVWAVRLGAALALSAGLLAEANRAVFWQPVFSGRLHLNQFLRLKLASSMSDGARQTRADLEAQLQKTGYLDVAGYRINRTLAAEMAAVDLSSSTELPADLAWLEVAAGQQQSLARNAALTVERWQEVGKRVHTAAVHGDPYWATQELGFAPPLIEETTRWIHKTN